jgi:tripartite-type tricarboxylate transporter receptor subunit TctC
MWRLAALVCSLLFALNGLASAQSDLQGYPSKSVTIIVPSAPGGATDIVARVVAGALSIKWGVPVVTENISGAASNIGARRAAISPPDGYTLLVSPPAMVTFNKLLYSQLGYEPGDFTPITVLAKTPLALLVRRDLPVNSVQELIAYAKANPGKLSFGSSGVGTTLHLAGIRFGQLAGIELLHSPYRGELLVLNDLMGGHIDIFFGTLSTALPFYRAGKLKMLAVADKERSSAVPEVPTMIEAGVPNFVSFAWYALVAPPNAPKQLQEKINRDVVAILHDETIRQKLQRLLLEPAGGSTSDTVNFFASEAEVWGAVIKKAKIPAQ